MIPLDLAHYYDATPDEQARRHRLRRELTALADAMDSDALAAALAAVVATVAAQAKGCQ